MQNNWEYLQNSYAVLDCTRCLYCPVRNKVIHLVKDNQKMKGTATFWKTLGQDSLLQAENERMLT